MSVQSSALTSRMVALRNVEAIFLALSVVLGWLNTVQQIHSDGWSSGSAWMVVLASAATLGGSLWFGNRRHASAGRIVVALLLVAASPVVFAYPITLVVLCLAIVELVLTLRSAHRRGADLRYDQ